MLASSAVFMPRLRGTLQAESDVWVPISSTNTSRFGSASRATSTLQAALNHSSRSSAPTLRFWLKPSRFRTRLTVESLKALPVSCVKKWRLSETVAAGRSRTFTSRSFSVAPSTLVVQIHPSPQRLAAVLDG
jgi:hypothetical protein